MADFKFAESLLPKIEAGTKIHTIRKDLRCKPGDPMNLFNAKDGSLFAAVICKMTVPVVLTEEGVQVALPGCQIFMQAAKKAASEFAIEGGFEDYYDMYDWFAAEYNVTKFYGFCHRWEK